jgi:hypothetical protein
MSMANEEQLAILKQGVDVWNKWRKTNRGVKVELREANLTGTNLRGADLRVANLSGADLHVADLTGADLFRAKLTEADLGKANLIEANFSGADLRVANLSGAHLIEANFSMTDLRETNLRKASLAMTVFSKIDLRSTLGLDDVDHGGPSTIGIDTLQMSQGKIPEIFLKGCGLSDADIEYAKLSNPDLSNEEINKILYKIYDLRATQALQISPLFISYSHSNGPFVDKLETQLNKKGIRFWRDIHEMKAGRIETQIDRAITQNRTVLLVLSEQALNSDWVEHEVRTARTLEKDIGRDMLCPVALDDSWKSSRWPKRIMEQIREYNILDFSAWEDAVQFEGMFRKLIDGLELFYKG